MTSIVNTAAAPECAAAQTETDTDNLDEVKSVDRNNIHSLSADDYAEGVLGAAWSYNILHHVLTPRLGTCLRSDGLQAHRRQLQRDHARPGNQLDGMLIDQVTWCHFQAGQLMVEATASRDPKERQVLTESAIKLMTEVRRTVLALTDLRNPQPAKQVTVVKQQNVAAGSQQVALVEAGATTRGFEKTTSDSKLVSNGALEGDGRIVAADPTTDCWPTESAETRPAVDCTT